MLEGPDGSRSGDSRSRSDDRRRPIQIRFRDRYSRRQGAQRLVGGYYPFHLGEKAPAASYAPHEIHTFSTPNDPHDFLPPAAQKKWSALVHRAADLHAAIPLGEAVREAAEAVTVHQRRIADLTRLKSEGGNFGLSDDAASVLAERKKLERAVAERDRVKTLYEIRGARWNTCVQLRGAVSDWVLRGIPHGCVIESVEDAPLSELLTKADGGRIDAAVQRHRMRLRELAADRHRVRSSSWPSSLVKEKIKAEIEARADASAPDADRAVEFGLPVRFATTITQAMVTGAPAVVSTESVDVLGLLCWLWRDEIVSKVCAAVDEISDDKNSLGEAQREEREAQISSDELEIHRRICALIWHVEAAQGEIVDFAADTPPEALLGVRLVNQPRTSSSGTSPMHAFDIIGGR